jgi:hypothetical protein
MAKVPRNISGRDARAAVERVDSYAAAKPAVTWCFDETNRTARHNSRSQKRLGPERFAKSLRILD